MDNRFFPLPFQFDPAKLAADLATCEAQQWAMHFNKNDYAGDWTGIALRSATGKSLDINAIARDAFQDTPLLEVCLYFREILDNLNFEQETVRLLALAPGSVIKEHRDRGLGYEHGCFRLHIPITTDDQVSFVVDGVRLQMDEGQCWYANFDLPHSVRHKGTNKRIHLVIDGKRNAWTDQLFAACGYNFELEKQGKEMNAATKAEMIAHLRLMDNEGARMLLTKLSAEKTSADQVPAHAYGHTEPSLTDGWIPTSVQADDSGLVIKWLYLGEKSFSELFFHETLQNARRFELNKTYPNRHSSLEQLIEIAQKTESIAPTAFIFHVSRCGSTLLSQLLHTDALNIALSEAPILDAILRLPYQGQHVEQDTVDRMFLAAISLLGRKRNSVEQHFFIKTDCWHVFFYDTLRRLFPNTPFLLLYRSPDEVLRSQQKIRGIQAIPTILEPELTGIPEDLLEPADLDGYFIQVLERIFVGFIQIKTWDTNAFLVNYNSGQKGMILALERATGLQFSADTLKKMERRSQFHAKEPKKIFEEEARLKAPSGQLLKVMALYEQLDRMV